MSDEKATICDNLLQTDGSTEIIKARILELRSTGMLTKEIAAHLQISRATVSRHLNSPDVKKHIQEARDRFRSLLDSAVDVYEKCLHDGDDNSNARMAAKDVLESHGIVKKDVNLNHNFPKPTIIKRRDGTEIVLGTTADIAIESDG